MTALVKRVVLLGPPLAGKRTMVEALASARMAKVRAFKRPIKGEAQACDVGPAIEFESGSNRCEIVTFSGGVFSDAAWPSLLESASGAVLVLDPQATRTQADKEAINTLEPFGCRVIGCVVVTKQDLIERGVGAIAAEGLLGSTPLRDWPVFRTRIDRPATLLEPIDWMLARLGGSAGAA